MVIPDRVRARARTFLEPAMRLWQTLVPPRTPYPSDFSEEDIAICAEVGPFTMTGPERILALRDATRYIAKNRVPGAIVECGVWRGGSMMLVARTLLGLNASTRDLYLFDTFEGMSPPSDLDRDARGVLAADLLSRARRQADFSPRVEDFTRWWVAPANATFNMWCVASREEVCANLRSTGYPSERVHLIAGRVEETIPRFAPPEIALLRLDTDWYESTKHELDHLFDRLVPGGVLIIDDYGHWQGARRATDDFFAARGESPLLQRIDFTGRLFVKQR